MLRIDFVKCRAEVCLRYKGMMYIAREESSFVVVVAPEKSLRSTPCGSFDKLRVVRGFYLFWCAAEHGED